MPQALPEPVIYYDVGSPFAYLAVERAEEVLGMAPRLQPVLLGGLFKLNGRSSWARTQTREAGMRDVEQRARRYGLPPIVWPEGWPGNYLFAMRMVTQVGDGLGRRLMRAAFAEGVDLSQPEQVLALCDGPPAEIADETKQALREATEAAHARGVFGVPTIEAGGQLFWGDDRLEEASRVISPR
jgi:2-hydroxychromene-2-carboxylate isomerase